MPIEDILNKLKKDFGEGMVFIGDLPSKERIPFSSPYLNYVTYGGVCFGTSSEFVGAESSGKSTLALDIVANFQRLETEAMAKRIEELNRLIPKAKGKELEKLTLELANIKVRKAVYLDLEFTLDAKWMRLIGVDADQVIIIHPPAVGVEAPLDWVVELADTGEVGLIIIDSVGAMISGAEEDKSISEFTYGGISKALTRFYKKIMPHISKQNIALIMVNQTRDDMSNPYNQFNRPGGRMNKFAQSISLGLSSGEKLDDKYAEATNKSEMVHAKLTNVQMIKNKTAPPDRQRTKFCLKHGHGIDLAYDVFSMACDFGLISQAGAFYTIFDPITGEVTLKVQGKSKAIQLINDDEALRKSLWERLYALSIEGQENA